MPMSDQHTITSVIREHKTLFIILFVGLLLIELEIFALAAVKSGRKSRLQVLDRNGNVIHETDGRQLSQFDKYYFEKTFGPFENYTVRLQSREVAFPFRAWFVAAVGIPLGVMLLFGFIVKAYVALFHGQQTIDPASPEASSNPAYRLEGILERVSRLNIFLIGFLILTVVLLYWIVPNLLVYLGETGAALIGRYKWILMGLVALFVGVGLWIIYLRYLLAKKSIEGQTEIEKYRLELEYRHQQHLRLPEGRAPAKQIGQDQSRTSKASESPDNAPH
jgi:hypothetical protein